MTHDIKVRHALVAAGVYAATIPAANWAINHWGDVQFPGGPHTIPVGFGLSAPSGVLFIGLALVARDAVQRTAGKRWAIAAIAIGCALSALISPDIAIASAAAFALGELADLAVYTPLAERNLYAAVALSGTVGAVVDSLIFLQLAFGSVDYWQGNVLGKTWMALAALPLIWIARRAVPQRLDTLPA